jgi:two-component system, NtrC family, response regulator HydG
MRALVLAPTSADGNLVVRELAACGVEASFFVWSGGSATIHFPDGTDRVIAILPGVSVLDLGEHVAQIREDLRVQLPILVCCQQLTPADRQRIIKCGASAIVAPKAWDAASVAERVLGELIASGDVKQRRSGEIWGGTAAMQELYRKIETLAPLAETVLILGETGTGKERVAQELHLRSRRPGKLFAVNCAEFTAELLSSELFGHERGAFSGADRKREGLLVAAGEGTFFLDEIGDLAPAAQAKLLRVVEERQVRPVGANHFEPVRARLILATRRNLEEAADEQFRRDLYERLRGFTLRVPALRERRADLPLLVKCFVDEYNAKYSRECTVPEQVLDSLFRHSWPGNVRELRAAVFEAATYAPNAKGPISAVHLLDAVQRRTTFGENSHSVSFDPSNDTWRQVHDRARAKYFRAVLAECGGNKDVAMHRTGLGRSQFYEILKTLDE